MFELHTTSDLLISLSQFIYNYRQSIGVHDLVVTPRIINQEKGGTVIFVWNDTIKPDLFVTVFGLYEPEAQKYSVIYTYKKHVKVVSCSVNIEKTLLAFSIAKAVDPLVDKKQKVVFQAYLAELQSAEKNVFSLNMERSTFLKVQFLYPEQTKSSHSKESDMLVFLHKESIGLYKIPTARIGERGIMMSGQPKTEQIVRKFVWCQWDAQYQRLHYIHNVRQANSDTVSHSMCTLQFKNNGKADNMISIPINFPFPYIRTADKPHYGDIPFHTGIPDLSLNISVLTQSSGTFCLCYHKLMSDQKSEHGPQSPNDYQNVEYYISMVHHAKTLYGCVSSLPKHVVNQKRLVFSWVGSYLLVMLPGYFVHLLNVGPSFEPCHHILLHDYTFDSESFPHPRPISVKFNVEDEMTSSQTSSMSHFSTSLTSSISRDRHSFNSLAQKSIPVFSEYCSNIKTLLPCQGFVRESGSIAQHLYDYRSGCMLKLVFNTDLILDSFQNTYWQTRLAILHYMILHNKDFFIVKKLFEILCDNLTISEINSMFTEFLVASTYAEMKKQVDREVLNLLAFTASQTLRGQYEKNSAGERLAHISYMPLEVVDYNKKLIKESKSRSKEDYWETLIRRLKLRHSELPTRFDHVTVMRTYRQAEMEEAGGKLLWDAMHVEDSFFDGVYTLKITEITTSMRRSLLSESTVLDLSASSGRQSRTDMVLGPAPLFLQRKISSESNIFKRRLSTLTEELLHNHLLKHLPKESHSKARNVAKEYLYCQAKVARQLCHLIWSLRGSELSQQLDDSLLPNLQSPGTNDEYELFQLFERFYLTVSDLGYPFPAGFSSFLTALGFKCLDIHLFFQYVDNHILILTPDFILQVLKDLPDDADAEIPLIKYQIISRLPQPFADECFERWDHPMSKERRARNQVSQILLRAPNVLKENPSQHRLPPSAITSTFPPLSTFLKHLELAASNIQSNRPIPFDPQLVESVALHHTRTKTNVDLSLVSF
nr:protein pigeon-like [Biomphalaria glabrata]